MNTSVFLAFTSTPAPWYHPIDLGRDTQIRIFGWFLLILWVGFIIYMTRDFFFPGIYKATREVSVRSNQKTRSRTQSVEANADESQKTNPIIEISEIVE